MSDEASANKKLGLPTGKMEKLVYCFDIDGTLRNNTVDQTKAPIANERIRTLLIILSTFKNIKIVIWSGSGELYARQIGAAFGLDSYVWRYASKYDRDKLVKYGRIMVVDDIQNTALGEVNHIVREK